MPYIVDADWVIQALAGRSSAVATLRQLVTERLSISLITVGEIYEVAFDSVNPNAHLASFREFLAPFRILTLNEVIVVRFAEIRSYLRRRGQLISDFDVLLAATALSNDLTVLTYNLDHFKRIPDLKIYQIS